MTQKLKTRITNALWSIGTVLLVSVITAMSVQAVSVVRVFGSFYSVPSRMDSTEKKCLKFDTKLNVLENNMQRHEMMQLQKEKTNDEKIDVMAREIHDVYLILIDKNKSK